MNSEPMNAQMGMVEHDSTGDGTPDDKGETAPPPSWLVWTVRVFSVGTLLAIIAYLLYLALRTDIPASFEIKPDFDAVAQRGVAWTLPIDVVNVSTEAVSDLMIEVVQTGPNGETARTATLVLVGEGETLELEMLFPERPRADAIETRVLSYQNP